MCFHSSFSLFGNLSDTLTHTPSPSLFPPSLLKVILVVHAATYQSVDKAHIGDGVGLTGAELETFLKAQANGGVVASVEEDRVVFAANKENQPRVRKFKEKVDLQNMLGILNRLAA